MGTNNSAKISEQGRIYSLDENDIIPVSSSGTRASITGDALKTIIKEEAKTVCVSTETTNQFLPATKIISVRFAFDANIPYTNIAYGVIRILKEELVGYVFVDGDKLHFRKQTVVTVNGVYLVQSQDETSITLTKLYNDEILNEVFVEENSLVGVWFSSYNGTSLTFDWIKPFNSHRGGVVKVDYEAGSPMQFRDIYTNELMFEVDENGQLISYGRDGFANGAFISKTAQGQFRFEINTLNGNSYVKLYNADEEVIVHLDSASASKLLGLDVSNERIRNVGNAVDDYDALNKSQSESLFIPKTQNILTKEPTGFSRNDSLVITANGDRTITLSGMVSASYRGDAVTEIINGWISPLHGTDTTKLYYLYYNGSTISWSENVFAFDLLQICIAKYDNTNARWYYFREAHGFMPWQDHFEFHNNIGTYKSSGGLIPTNSYVLRSTVASERRIDVNEALIYDEDLPSVIPALTSKSYTQFALTGAGIDNIGLAKTDYINLSTNNPYYNKFTTQWVNTLVPANSVFTVWDYVLPMTADSISQDYRHLFVQPQWITQAQNPSAGAIATAVTAEKNRLPSELNLNGLLSTEIVAINRITLSYHSGNWRIESIDVLSGNKYSQIGSPSGNYLTNSHLPFTSSGHTGTPLKIFGTGINGEAVEIDDPTTIANEALELAEYAVSLGGGGSSGLTTQQVNTLIEAYVQANSWLLDGNFDIDIWGDSLVEGDWGQYLALYIDRTVNSHGYGGKTSTYIRDVFVASSNTTIIAVGRNNFSEPETIIDDIRYMVSQLTHRRFIIITPPNGVYSYIGEGIDNAVTYAKFTQIEQRLSEEYGANYLNSRLGTINSYDNGNVKLLASFVQPAINANVQISVSDTSFLTTYNASDVTYLGSTVTNKIVIGINNLYDIYDVVSVDSATLMTVKLITQNRIAPTAVVDNLIDVGGNSAIKYLRVMQNADYYCYNQKITQSTFRVDGIHQSTRGKQCLAQLVANKLSTMKIY